MYPVVIAVYLHSQIQQHSDNSISGSTHECDSAPFDPAYWKDDGQTENYAGPEVFGLYLKCP
jgi:hypothetical protein